MAADEEEGVEYEIEHACLFGLSMITQLMRCLYIKTKQHNTTERQSSNNTTQLHPKQSFFKEKMSCLRWNSNPRPSVF